MVIEVGAPDSSECNRLRAALIYSVTHEFLTPLTSIKVAVSALMANQRVRRSQLDELLSIINEEAEPEIRNIINLNQLKTLEFNELQ